MRMLTAVLLFAFGCGRFGFSPDCNHDDSSVTDVSTDTADAGPHIKRTQTFAPGGGQAPLTFTVGQAAGDFMIAATFASDGSTDISSSLGETWMTVPGETANCSSRLVSLRLYYTQLSSSGTNSITIGMSSPGSGVGGFLIEYSGVALINPIDSSSGTLAVAADTTFDAGALQLSAADQVVAAFAFESTAALTAGAGLQVQAHDDSFNAMIEDGAVPAGTFTATASLPTGITTDCWTGTSVALHAQ